MANLHDNNDDDDDEIEQHLLERINHAIKNQGENKNLETKFASIRSEVVDLITMLKAKENQIHKDNWLGMRRENLYYLNNLLAEWQIINNQTLFFPKDSRKNIKKILKNMMEEISGHQDPKHPKEDDHDQEDKSTSHHQIPNPPIFTRNKEEVYRWSSRYPPRKVHGFDHILMAVERDLVLQDVDAPIKVFGVVGVAGIGKTTLCQTIFENSKLIKNHFSPRIWVCLSKQEERNNNEPNKEIVIKILESLGVEDEVIGNASKGDDSLRRLILLLRLQLIGKRYLIVLDDAWNDNNFFSNLTQKPQLDDNWGEELAYALPKGCGGTIISSSRSSALLEKMIGKEAKVQHLKRNTDEIIWEIFRDSVIGYDEDRREFPVYLEELKRGVLKKCDGIPLGAKLVANIARKAMTTPGGGGENQPVREPLKGGGGDGDGGGQ